MRKSNSCANPKKLCNCDKNDFVWREDSGLLTNKSHLPITQLRYGDTDGAREEGYHTLRKLECNGIRRISHAEKARVLWNKKDITR